MRSEDYKYITTSFDEHKMYTFAMKVKDLLSIYYVAHRGRSTEQGAVQRVLSTRRINDIRDFILDGNTFVNTFIINWTSDDMPLKIKKDTLNLPLDGRYAQILDGQHRVAGLKEAFDRDNRIGENEILVSLCIGLNTSNAAKIFLNINSEQKPVPKSLIFDLFGEAVDDKEHAINRVTDIIKEMHTNTDSPYYHLVKYPGGPRSTGLIDLSIMVNAMKPHFEKEGIFHQLKLTEIEIQQRIIINFYSAIKKVYNENNRLWDKKTENPFIKAAGFSGAFEFLTDKLLQKCQEDRKFGVEHMLNLMKIHTGALITTSDVKQLDGRTAKTHVKQFFNSAFLQDIPSNSNEYEF